ncbi:hypothetical protein M8C21_017427 [Ambrosia artemisiifolia]|uniref:DUF8039 domain-containing protein n=1 Tax=Ambrosia artemisiifolia TaxID=4212 RepID=A0AAD5CW28_AMBAR|nr:hypothetical protein M8C21_017427 [Ambrosia artemisiifolia]
MSKRGRGKRGVASCSKKLKEDELLIEFDDDMIAMGKQKGKFASWLGLTLRARFPYHIPTKEFDKQRWENLWLDAKERSAKATASALQNKDHHRMGCTGYRGLKDKLDGRWKQVSDSNSSAQRLQNERSQVWVAGRAIRNKQTGLYEDHAESEMKADGTYYQGREDPLTRCFGPEHGGRTRTISYVIGKTKVHGGLYKCDKQQNQNGTETRSNGMVNVNQDTQCAPDEQYINYPDIQVIYDLPRETTIAKGQAYPTRNRTLHSKRITDGCVKVQVDTVIPGYQDTDVPLETVQDEVKHMVDTLAGFIRWPRNVLKIVNTEAPHKSTSASRKTPSHSVARQFQTSQQTHTCDIENSTSAYIPEFVTPGVNEVQQQMPSTVQIDASNIVDSDDFVESLWAIPIVNQILRQQNEESDKRNKPEK